ncbi:hypothetical protein TNCV_3988011 [Trichonephila clavipes]|nr:hypothetical protein TNCV_3988011 [Trichonephila clavipes]
MAYGGRPRSRLMYRNAVLHAVASWLMNCPIFQGIYLGVNVNNKTYSNHDLTEAEGRIRQVPLFRSLRFWAQLGVQCEAPARGCPCSPLSTRPVSVGKDKESCKSFILISAY